jgi:hypothetical protein
MAKDNVPPRVRPGGAAAAVCEDDRERVLAGYGRAGGISWFAWMKLSGSYFDLTSRRRS